MISKTGSSLRRIAGAGPVDGQFLLGFRYLMDHRRLTLMNAYKAPLQHGVDCPLNRASRGPNLNASEVRIIRGIKSHRLKQSISVGGGHLRRLARERLDSKVVRRRSIKPCDQMSNGAQWALATPPPDRVELSEFLAKYEVTRHLGKLRTGTQFHGSCKTKQCCLLCSWRLTAFLSCNRNHRSPAIAELVSVSWTRSE